jgi:hypothetical protein
VQSGIPNPTFRTSCFQAWTDFLERAKGVEELETCLLPCPETKLLYNVGKLRTLILNFEWRTMGFDFTELNSFLSVHERGIYQQNSFFSYKILEILKVHKYIELFKIWESWDEIYVLENLSEYMDQTVQAKVHPIGK